MQYEDIFLLLVVITQEECYQHPVVIDIALTKKKSTLKLTFQKQLNITPTFKKFLQEIQTHPS